MSSDYAVLWIIALGACFGVTLQKQLTRDKARAFAVAKWLQWTALVIAALGFFGPLAIIVAASAAGCAWAALYFAYHQNRFGTGLAAILGLLVTFASIVAELIATNQY